MKIFDDVIACDLWFRPCPIKNPGYAYEIGDQFFEDLFFGEHLRLCPLPWPWIIFVFLASSLVSSTPPLLITSYSFNLCDYMAFFHQQV